VAEESGPIPGLNWSLSDRPGLSGLSRNVSSSAGGVDQRKEIW
jgi:hypothetical protein